MGCILLLDPGRATSGLATRAGEHADTGGIAQALCEVVFSFVAPGVLLATEDSRSRWPSRTRLLLLCQSFFILIRDKWTRGWYQSEVAVRKSVTAKACAYAEPTSNR